MNIELKWDGPLRLFDREQNISDVLQKKYENEKGVYLFGSNVSVWAIPPAIQSRMTVSALEFVLLLLQEDNKLVKGAPAASAARVAALLFFINSLLFQ